LKGFQTPSKILTLLFSKVIYKETLDGENLIQYGDEVDYFYLIKKGKVSLFNKTFDYMYDLEEGSFFGE
jgi:hypothetical protein